jgi:hypothetical protein
VFFLRLGRHVLDGLELVGVGKAGSPRSAGRAGSLQTTENSRTGDRNALRNTGQERPNAAGTQFPLRRGSAFDPAALRSLVVCALQVRRELAAPAQLLQSLCLARVCH